MAERHFSLEMIEDFLGQKRIAMIGVSRDPKHFSMNLFEELCRRGYDVIPVNPGAPSINGRHCFQRVQEIQPPVKAALLMTPPVISERIMEDCYVDCIVQVWLYWVDGNCLV